MSASTPPLDLMTGWRYPRTQPSLPESNASVRVPRAGSFWRKALAFAGPGYMVAIGYMDPGNWATDIPSPEATRLIECGSQYQTSDIRTSGEGSTYVTP